MSTSALLLGLCQFLFMAAVAVGISFNGLVGKILAPTPYLATLPFLTMMGCTALLTLFMPRVVLRLGYRRVFIGGATAGVLGGGLGALAIWHDSFAIFCCAGIFMGLYQASALYYRFAAADAVPAEHKSNAIAWVLSGGIIAALLGPVIGSSSLHFFPIDYVGSYLATAFLAVVAAGILTGGAFFSRNSFFTVAASPRPSPQPLTATEQTLSWRIISPGAFKGMLFCITGYSMMGMVMLASPLAMSTCGFHAQDAASVIQWHLLGMFAPSLLTGKIIARFGAQHVALAGLAILSGGCLVALSNQTLETFHVALLIIGVGWNFMYMGGSTLLAQIDNTYLRSRLQALNEFLTFASVTLIAGLTGWLYEALGWQFILYCALTLLATAATAFIFYRD